MLRFLATLLFLAATSVTTPAAASPCVSGTPPSDATSLIQGCINAGGEVFIPCGTWNVSGLTGGIVRGVPGCTVIHITGAAAAFNCSASSAPFVVRDLVVTGTAPNFDGTWTSITDTGQKAVHVSNCPSVLVSGVRAQNIAGSAFDCEQPAGAFNTPSVLQFAHLAVSNSYRAYYTHNSCEYVGFTDVVARNNVWGADIQSGNVSFANFIFSYNYNNIHVVGQSNPNPCHGSFTGGRSNHGTYNLQVIGCAIGMDFTGVEFIGDQGGQLTAGGGVINIDSSSGVNIIGGEIGSNIQMTGTNGANKIQGAFIRTDIPGFVNPVGAIELKLNFTASGQWSQNN